jgi:hypothetical protein
LPKAPQEPKDFISKPASRSTNVLEKYLRSNSNSSVDANASNSITILTGTQPTSQSSWTSNLAVNHYNQQKRNISSPLVPKSSVTHYAVTARSKSFSRSRSPSPSSRSSSFQLLEQVQYNRSCESSSTISSNSSDIIRQPSNNPISNNKTSSKHFDSDYSSSYFRQQQQQQAIQSSLDHPSYYQVDHTEFSTHNPTYKSMSALKQEQQQQQPLPPPPITSQSSGGSSFAPRELNKLKRFLTTLQQFAADISPEIGERVRNLVHSLVVRFTEI